MQQPTCRNMRIRSVHDAQVILHAVAMELLPMLLRRLDDEERQALAPGDIYVWEERSSNPNEAPSLEAMQRFTDGRSWGPSKARDDFLVYREKDTTRNSLTTRSSGLQSMSLIKQTYSAYVDGPRNSRKWHLNAYYTSDTVDHFNTIDDFPELRSIQVPAGRYLCARTSAQRKSRPAAPRSPSAEEGAAVHLSATYPDVSISTTSLLPGMRGSAAVTTGYSTDGQIRLTSLECRLAPLEYLQSLSPGKRDPVDEQVLRSFRR